jgi:splicing factor 3B subunit 2
VQFNYTAGVNAPIPAGARYGFANGEWGRPPVDGAGRPRFGDVFGVAKHEDDEANDAAATKELWAAIVSDGEESEEEESDDSGSDDDDDDDEAVEGDDEENDDAVAATGDSNVTAAAAAAATTGDDVAMDIDPAAALQLRKKASGAAAAAADLNANAAAALAAQAMTGAPRQLYTVLDTTAASVGNAARFGSSHTYAVPTTNAATEATIIREAAKAAVASSTVPVAELGGVDESAASGGSRRRGAADVEVTLSPGDLEGMDAAALKRKYDEQVAANKSAAASARRETGVDDVFAERAAKKAKTKGKDFKF